MRNVPSLYMGTSRDSFVMPRSFSTMQTSFAGAGVVSSGRMTMSSPSTLAFPTSFLDVAGG